MESDDSNSDSKLTLGQLVELVHRINYDAYFNEGAEITIRPSVVAGEIRLERNADEVLVYSDIDDFLGRLAASSEVVSLSAHELCVRDGDRWFSLKEPEGGILRVEEDREVLTLVRHIPTDVSVRELKQIVNNTASQTDHDNKRTRN